MIVSGLNCFVLSYSVSNLMTLNETSGVITSPFYLRDYGTNQTCSWQIRASKGKQVKLFIEDIDLQEASCRCGYQDV